MTNPVPSRILLPHRLLGNIYVQELGRAYQQLGCEVIYGPENFFESNFAPDIVHLNWPEDLYRSFGSGSHADRAARVSEGLDRLKMRGGRLAWTVHNEKPHESSEALDSRIYQRIIDAADVIHHHCDCSREKLAARYRVPAGTSQFVAAHGHFLAYRNDRTRDEAREKLRLPHGSFVYLHFGSIRGYKGIDQVLDAFRRVRGKGDVLLVAGRMTGTGDFPERLKFACYKSFYPSLRFHLRMIDSDDIQDFVNAADAMVLGHTDGLNSGVAVLGMSFGRAVIGPLLGCIPSVLDQGLNLTYETGSVEALAEKMVAVKMLSPEQCVQRNRAAAVRWKWEDIAQPVIDRLGVRRNEEARVPS